jgi:hypothetical protein
MFVLMSITENYNIGGSMKLNIIALVLSLLVVAGCSQLTLKQGDFAWPVESVLKVDGKGMVQDERYSFSLNVKDLLFEETKDSVNVQNIELRMIRDMKGYFFVTSSKFKNVYVFEQTEGALKFVNKILVSQNGLNSPAFNQRIPYIQLVNEQNPPIMLTKEGIKEGDNK